MLIVAYEGEHRHVIQGTEMKEVLARVRFCIVSVFYFSSTCFNLLYHFCRMTVNIFSQVSVMKLLVGG